MKSYLTKMLLAICVMLSISFLSGCSNTVRGAGEDMNNLGNAMDGHHKKVQKTTVTTTQVSKLDATSQPIQKNSDIPEETY